VSSGAPKKRRNKKKKGSSGGNTSSSSSSSTSSGAAPRAQRQQQQSTANSQPAVNAEYVAAIASAVASMLNPQGGAAATIPVNGPSVTVSQHATVSVPSAEEAGTGNNDLTAVSGPGAGQMAAFTPASADSAPAPPTGVLKAGKEHRLLTALVARNGDRLCPVYLERHWTRIHRMKRNHYSSYNSRFVLQIIRHQYSLLRERCFSHSDPRIHRHVSRFSTKHAVCIRCLSN
jgi:hypothetical protein